MSGVIYLTMKYRHYRHCKDSSYKLLKECENQNEVEDSEEIRELTNEKYTTYLRSCLRNMKLLCNFNLRNDDYEEKEENSSLYASSTPEDDWNKSQEDSDESEPVRPKSLIEEDNDATTVSYISLISTCQHTDTEASTSIQGSSTTSTSSSACQIANRAFGISLSTTESSLLTEGIKRYDGLSLHRFISPPYEVSNFKPKMKRPYTARKATDGDAVEKCPANTCFSDKSVETATKNAIASKVNTRTINLLVIGDSGVGKSSLIRKFTDGEFSDSHVPTFGPEIKIKSIELLGCTAELNLWDVSSNINIFSCYVREADGILIIYDITSEASFDSIKDYLLEVMYQRREEVPKMLIGNKADLSAERRVPYDSAEEFAERYQMLFLELSARNASVNNAIRLITEKIISSQ